MNKAAFLLISTLMLSVPAKSHAVILFLDINNAPREIAAAQRAVDEINKKKLPDEPAEELVVVSISRENQLKLKEIAQRSDKAFDAWTAVRAKQESLQKKIKALKTKIEVTNGAKKTRLESELEKLQTEIENVNVKHEQTQAAFDAITEEEKDLKRNTTVNINTISIRLDELQAAGKKVNSLIISGHSKGYNFFGEFGDIYLDEINDAFEQRGMKSSVAAAYLLGCYTATDISRHWWREHFPEMKFFAGFRYKGPTRDGAAPEVLNTLLKKEKETISASELSESAAAIEKTLKGTFPILKKYNAGIYANAVDCSFGRKGSEKEDCENTVSFLHNEKSCLYYPYFNLHYQGCNHVQNPLDVPPDSQNSDIRRFYNELLDAQSCIDPCIDDELPDPAWCKDVEDWLPRIDTTLALIKFHYVRQNFQFWFADEIGQANKQLSSIGCSKLLDLSTSGRKVVLTKTKELNKCCKDNDCCSPSKPELASVCSIRAKSFLLLKRLSCVPDKWLSAPPRSAPTLAGKPEYDPSQIEGCENAYTSYEDSQAVRQQWK